MPESTKNWRIEEHSKLFNAKKKGGKRVQTDWTKAKATDFVVTEKVHGANFSFRVNADGVCHWKRRSKLEPDEDFFGFQAIAQKLDEKMMGIWSDAQDKDNLAQIIVFGELFGGTYPHKDVADDANVPAPVQSEIFYSPSIEFLAFDVAFVHANDDKMVFLSYCEMAELLSAAQVPFLRPLALLSFNEAMQFPLEFETKVPAALGLPPIANNFAEGVVIKPATKALQIGTKKAKQRLMLKRKAKRFSEIVCQHAQNSNRGGAEANVQLELTAFVNQNRVNAAFSKLGRKKKAAVREEVLQDIFNDALTENDARNEQWLALTAAARERIQKHLEKEIEKIV